MRLSTACSYTSAYIKWIIFILFYYNFNLYSLGCLGLSVSQELRLKNSLSGEMLLTSKTARRTKLNQITFENISSSHLPDYFEIIIDINKKNNMLDESKNLHFQSNHIDRSLKIFRSNNRAIRSTSKSSRKNQRSKSRGKKKNLEESQQGLIRKYKANDITINRKSDRPLCPVWPTDPRMIANCSNGRRLRSLCTVGCISGFHLQKGAPTKRRCLSSSRKHGQNSSKAPKPLWSRKDDQYACVSICDDLPAPDNGKIVCGTEKVYKSINTFTNRSCAITCDPGFIPSKSSTRYCMNNGTWSGYSTTCQASSSKFKRNLFVFHQKIECGNVHSLTTFTYQDTTFLVAGDVTGKQIRVYRWIDDHFLLWQIIETRRPFVVEVNPSQRKHLWLLVGNRNSTAFYRMNAEKKFVFFSLRKDFFIATEANNNLQMKGLNFLRTNGDIYRCKGNHSKRGRSIIFVQKLITKKNKRPSFKRIMRKKMKNGDTLVQCALFFLKDKLYTATSINNRNGVGKILFGVAQKKRMRIIHKITHPKLRNVSDLDIFDTSNGRKMLVVSQTLPEGKCFVYQKSIDGIEGG